MISTNYMPFELISQGAIAMTDEGTKCAFNKYFISTFDTSIKHTLMAIYTQIQTDDLNQLLSPYGIDAIDFKPMEGGNCNSNYSIHSKEGQFILTIAEESSVEEVEKLAKLLQHLAEHNFLTSQVYHTTAGNQVRQYLGKPVYLKKWISGIVHEDLSPDILRQIGQSMAQLHQVPVPDYLPQVHPFGLECFPSVLDKNIDSKYESWLKNRLQLLVERLPGGLPKGLIHGDLFFDNVLIENNNFKAIIDFEGACHYYLSFDLGMAIIGLCQTGKSIDLKKVTALIAGYENVRSLKIEEKKHLQYFIQYAAIAISFWRFWRYNIFSPRPDMKNKHWEMVQIVKEVEALDHDDFITSLP